MTQYSIDISSGSRSLEPNKDWLEEDEEESVFHQKVSFQCSRSDSFLVRKRVKNQRDNQKDRRENRRSRAAREKAALTPGGNDFCISVVSFSLRKFKVHFQSYTKPKLLEILDRSLTKIERLTLTPIVNAKNIFRMSSP